MNKQDPKKSLHVTEDVKHEESPATDEEEKKDEESKEGESETESEEEDEKRVKLVLVGDTTVGKSCLIV